MRFIDLFSLLAGFVPLDLQTQRSAAWVDVPEGKKIAIVLYKGTGVDGDDPIITMQQAQNTGGGGAKALNFTKIYRAQGADVTLASFTETTQAAANTYTNTDGHQQLFWIVEFDYDDLDVANLFTFVRMTLNDTGLNPQLGCVFYFVQNLQLEDQLADLLADILAIKAKTDNMNFTVPGQVDSNVLYVHNVMLDGSGTGADPWRPA